MLALGGQFELESSPVNGTTATLVLPLRDRSVESSLIATHESIMEPAKGQATHHEWTPDMMTVQALNPVASDELYHTIQTAG